MAESVKESIDYAECKLKKKKLLKLLDRKTKKVLYLEKRANLLKKLPFLGCFDRSKLVLRTKWYLIPLLAVVPLFALFGKTIYDSGFEQPDIVHMMVPATYLSLFGNVIFTLIVLFLWLLILGIISLAIVEVIVEVVKFTSYVFSDRYLVIELKELVERIEKDKRAIKKAQEELNLLNEELELYAEEKE